MPVANKPVLFYGLEAMAQAGIREVGIIIAPETGEEIRVAVGDGSQFGLEVTYIVQDEPARPRPRRAHRRDFLGASPVRHVPGRQPAAGRHHRARGRVPRPRPRRADPAHAGARPRVLRRGRARRRPGRAPGREAAGARAPTSRWSASTCSRRRSSMPPRRSSPRAAGELEITDAIQHLVDRGLRVEPHVVRGWWKDTGRLEDMLEANRLDPRHDRARAWRAS